MIGHGGNRRALAAKAGIDPSDILDLSANINPLGAPSWLRPVISRAIEDLGDYPDPDSVELRTAVAHAWGVHTLNVIPGNGANQLIHLIPRIENFKRAVICPPAYIDYASAAENAGLPVKYLPRQEKENFEVAWEALQETVQPGDLVFLGHPNNPTGTTLDLAKLRETMQAHADAVFVIDEAFIDFVEDCPSLIREGIPNCILVRSFTKFYAIPGLRLGFAVAPSRLASKLAAVMPAWSVNTIAQQVGIAAIRDEDFARVSKQAITDNRNRLFFALSEIKALHVYPSQVNYLLCRLDRAQLGSKNLAETLLTQHRIAIRPCDNYVGLDERYFRVAVRDWKDSQRLIDAMHHAVGQRKHAAGRRQPTPSVMFQGTSSNAGKSIMAAGFCRMLLQDGIRVAPFKAQNMSNNSYVTLNGEEVARAQVVQAQASRVDPDVRISPILLKPCSDVGCQVILQGKPVGNMKVKEYDAFKPEAFEKVKECYDSLADEFDAIVLEGAGSPGEVNLKADDIVNMRMAAYAESPVILVGDIDRGGVFASFVGTMEVLEQWERDLMAGFLVNKFRGDASLLDDAFTYVQRHTGKPVFGTIPFVRDLGLPEEDSVTFKELAPENGHHAVEDSVEIAVIDLPHISNLTDIDALKVEPDVRLRVVRANESLGTPDAIVIPGSKNTIVDLQALRNCGLADQIIALADTVEIVGICGGLQMLGERIRDPYAIESDLRETPGMGLLPQDTEMAREKVLRQVTGKHLPSGEEVRGYEIHHGQTPQGGVEVIIKSQTGDTGVAGADGRIWGTYLHGVFDADGFRRWFIDRLRQRKGLTPLGSVQASYDLEPAFDRLAEIMRENMDVSAIYRAMGL